MEKYDHALITDMIKQLAIFIAIASKKDVQTIMAMPVDEFLVVCKNVIEDYNAAIDDAFST